MAEMGAHSALSGAIAISACQSSISLPEKVIVVVVFSTLGHFFLDVFPHGHTKKKWKELISGAVIVPFIFLYSFLKGGLELFFLSGLAMFFGNLFDFLLILSERFKKTPNWLGVIARKISEFNLWIHWFVRSQTFCLEVRQEISKEAWKGRPVYSWKYDWYNFIPLVFSLIALYVSLTL